MGRGSVTIVLRWYGMQESEHPVASEHLSVTSVDSKCYAIDWLMLEKSSPTLIPFAIPLLGWRKSTPSSVVLLLARYDTSYPAV